jgi:hypothetical protein
MSAIPPRRVSAYQLHEQAIGRHAAWACDFAMVGELDAAVGELLDVCALASELGATVRDGRTAV